MRSALNSSVVWELTADGERLFHCGIVRGKKEFFRASSGHHCMSGIYNTTHNKPRKVAESSIQKHGCNRKNDYSKRVYLSLSTGSLRYDRKFRIFKFRKKSLLKHTTWKVIYIHQWPIYHRTEITAEDKHILGADL